MFYRLFTVFEWKFVKKSMGKKGKNCRFQIFIGFDISFLSVLTSVLLFAISFSRFLNDSLSKNRKIEKKNQSFSRFRHRFRHRFSYRFRHRFCMVLLFAIGFSWFLKNKNLSKNQKIERPLSFVSLLWVSTLVFYRFRHWFCYLLSVFTVFE